MSEVRSTKDYDVFKYFKENRRVEPGHVQRLADSIKDRNLLEHNPIIVNEDLYVIDGQNRIAACRLLGIQVFFIIIEGLTVLDIPVFNRAAKNWTLSDFVHAYSFRDIPAYKQINEIAEKSGWKVSEVIPLFFNVEHMGAKVRDGKIHTLTDHQLREIDTFFICYRSLLELMTSYHPKQVPILKNRNARKAVYDLCRLKDFSLDKLCDKMKIVGNRFHTRASNREYLELLLEIYNWKTTASSHLKLKKEAR